MRVVLDTNSVVSGLLWHGSPRSVLDLARSGQLSLFTSGVLLSELYDVLSRQKFAARLAAAGTTARELMLGYAALTTVVRAAPVSGAVPEDPDDDQVLGCAIASKADFIVSGDSHLLRLREYEGVPIRSAGELLELLPHNEEWSET